MLLFWAAYTILYAITLWSHLNAPGPSYASSMFLLPAGLPLVNTPTTYTTFNYTPVLIEIPAPIPTPTSIRILIPDTIIFPAAPLPTARLPHQALPLCYDGLHDDSPSVPGSPTRTVTGTTTDLIADGPGLPMRYLLVSLALVSALTDYLVRIPVLGHVLIWIPALVSASWVFYVMRRVALNAAAAHIRVVYHCPCSYNREDHLVTATSSPTNASSTPSPSSPSPVTPFKKLVTMGPGLSKTGRLIARKQRNHLRKQTPAKASGTPAALRNDPPRNTSPRHNSRKNHPRNDPPPTTAETDSRVWTVNGSSIIEYAPSVRRYNKRGSPVGNGLADLD